MTETLLLVSANAFLLLALALLALLAKAKTRESEERESLLARLDAHESRSERAVRDELSRTRGEELASMHAVRGELALALQGVRTEVTNALKGSSDSLVMQLQALTESNRSRLEAVRTTVEVRLEKLAEQNTAKLEEMRATVDEKLQGTLEKRLGESFQQVSERLERVHKGLGEMAQLASGVGDLKKVLTNVKTRGTWGEIHLEALLEQVLTAGQYEKNVATRPGSAERVEFAILLPEGVRLPVDAKFPQEDYLRLVDAAERADAAAVEAAGKALEARVKGCAKDIAQKYLEPPHTTEFAILYLPVEGLFAEVVRRPALVEQLQREWHVTVAGPTTLTMLLNSLQMGFRTLAIQKRSSEVWNVLGAVKTEFGKFGLLLDGVQKKLASAQETVEDAARKTRTIERRLKDVQAAPIAAGAPAPSLLTTSLLEEEAPEARSARA